MSRTSNAQAGARAVSFKSSTIVLGILAGAVAILAMFWLFAGAPLQTALYFIGGLLAGAVMALAWRQHTRDTNAQALSGIGTKTEKAILWKDLAAAMPDPAIVLDRSSAILTYNAAARTLFDRLKPGLPLEHVNRDPELITAVTRALQSGDKGLAHLVPRGGAGQRLLATVTPFGGGERPPPLAVLITIHDQSEQHRLLEMRSDFIANASHELRTPLASLRGFIETLQGPARNDEAARERFLTIMADQAERMTRLIHDLLLLSRVEEKVNLKPTGRVDLNEVIAEVVRALTPTANDRQMTITLTPSAGPVLATGDRDELFQVFHNLIENAVKYGRDRGSVVVSSGTTRVQQDGAFVDKTTVMVADDGPGIPPDHLPRLTERFYRVSNEQSRHIGGTGLGLAIVKHVLNRHGGELQIESVLGSGTTFRVILPVQDKIT